MPARYEKSLAFESVFLIGQSCSDSACTGVAGCDELSLRAELTA